MNASVTVEISSTLKRFTDYNSNVDIPNASTVEQLINQLVEKYPKLQSHLTDGNGEVRPFISIFVNSTDVRSQEGLKTSLAAGDRVAFLTPVAGG